jgi:hypothetical protein
LTRHGDIHPCFKRESVGVSTLGRRHATLAPNASQWVSQFLDDATHPHSKREPVVVSIFGRRHPTLAPNASWWVSRLSDDATLAPNASWCVSTLGRRHATLAPNASQWSFHYDTDTPSTCVHAAHFALGRRLSRGPLGPTPKLRPCVTRHLATPPSLQAQAGGYFITTSTVTDA